MRLPSAAAFSGNALAPGSIGTSFGHNLASRTAAAASNPLPTQLASTTLTLSASDGVDWLAQLFYVGPNQINFLIPEGAATITIRSDTQTGASGTLTLRAVAPGLFTANSSGQGALAGDVVVAALDNTETRQRLSFCGITPGSCIPSPIDLGPVGTQTVLEVYATGIRGRTSLAAVTTIGGINAEVLYADVQPEFTGLDQVNILIPATLAGRGLIDLVLIVDGMPANTVQLNIR